MTKTRPRLLIINNNMHIGGVQKALIDLIDRIKNDYDVTLLLFYAKGELMDKIPEGIHVCETRTHFRYLGMSQGECGTVPDKIFRTVYASAAKIFGIRHAVRLLSLFGKSDTLGDFDAVISYLHCPTAKQFYGGTAEYALFYPYAKKKICYVHCDYKHSGTCHPYSKKLYEKFDAVACVSESVRERFLSVLPLPEEKVIAIQNPINKEEVLRLSKENTRLYDKSYVNLISVARLSAEKGIDRFIRVLANLNRPSVRYYVVGEGPYRAQIEAEIEKANLKDRVFLLGKDANPYRHMVNADMLVVPSYHEAAPVVFQEAAALGLRVFTTRTTSADEMVPEGAGIVCENDEASMLACLKDVLETLQTSGKAHYGTIDKAAEETRFETAFRKLIG